MLAEATATGTVSAATRSQGTLRRVGAVGRKVSPVAGRAWAARLSDAHGRWRDEHGRGLVHGGGVDLGGGGGVAALDRALWGAASAVHGLEERLCAPTRCPGAHAGR